MPQLPCCHETPVSLIIWLCFSIKKSCLNKVLQISIHTIYFHAELTKIIIQYSSDINLIPSYISEHFLGILELHISDELRVEGKLHANGEDGGDNEAGGGAGGAILIYVNHLDGLGWIEANGGEEFAN